MTIPSEVTFLIIYSILLGFSYKEFLKPYSERTASLALAVIWSISAVGSACAVIAQLTLQFTVTPQLAVLLVVCAASCFLAYFFRTSVRPGNTAPEGE